MFNRARMAFVVVLLVGVSYIAVTMRGHETPPSGALQVLEVRGDAMVVRAGEHARLESYTALHEGDRVQTGEDGEVAFVLEDEATFRLGTSSILEVVSVDSESLSLSLDDGVLEATVRASRAVRVAGGGRRVLLREGDARFGAQGGVFQVEAVRGEVIVEAASPGVIGAGQQGVLTDRFARIGDVPTSLLLEVDWPDTTATRQRYTTVHGRTAPGARVTVGGIWGQVEVFADEEGIFQARVPLGEGDNEVEFSSLDPLGRVSEVYRGNLPVRDTTGPRFRSAVDYGQ